MRFYLLIGLLIFSGSLYAQDPKVPEVDSAEVMRRGDMVVIAGEGPRSDASEAFLTAMAPPADDSHKWFVTVLTMKNCAPCEALKRDFRRAPELLSFVTAPEEAKAWAHYNEYSKDDETQAFRVKEYKVTSFPTVVVQPPRNGIWGSGKTVVFQVSGYDGKPQKLADLIRDGVRRYTTEMSKHGYPKEPPKNAGLVTESVVGGAAQGSPESPIGVDPPFVTPSAPDPFNPSPSPSVPSQWPPQQPSPSPQNPSGEPSLIALVTLLMSLLGGGGNWMIFLMLALNTGMYLWDWYRERLKAQGKVPLISDAMKKQLEDLLAALAQKNPQSVPSVTVNPASSPPR